jgi:DNA-binding GntR family transcriptional regulator
VQFTRKDILGLFELRKVLENYALNKVSRLGLMHPADKENLMKMADIVLALKDKLQQPEKFSLDSEQMHLFIAADFSFHAFLISLSQNVRIHRVVNEIRLLMRVFTMRRQGHTIEGLDRIYKRHKALMNFIERKMPPQSFRCSLSFAGEPEGTA